ncbi:MAG: O-antigen ligase family protein [Halioglobus sp.]
MALALYYFWYTERHTLHARDGALADPLFMLAAALALTLGLSGLWSTGESLPDHGQIWARIIAAIGFMLIAAHAFATQTGFSTYLRHVIILATLVSTVICLLYFVFGPVPGNNRIHGLFRLFNPGRAGHQYAATLPFLAVSFALGHGKWRIMAAVAIALTAALIILTGTRAAWIGSAVGMLAFILATLRIRRAQFLALLTLGGAIVSGLFLYASLNPDSALHALLLPRGDSYRIAIWQTHIERLFSGPWLFGWGALTEQPYLFIIDMELRGAHNLYISTAEQIGVIGLALFVILLVWTGWRLLGHMQHASARLGLSLLVTGCVLSIFNGDRLIDKLGLVWFVFWLPVAIAVALNNAKDKNPKHSAS